MQKIILKRNGLFMQKGLKPCGSSFVLKKTKSDGGKPGRPDNYREGLLK